MTIFGRLVLLLKRNKAQKVFVNLYEQLGKGCEELEYNIELIKEYEKELRLQLSSNRHEGISEKKLEYLKKDFSKRLGTVARIVKKRADQARNNKELVPERAEEMAEIEQIIVLVTELHTTSNAIINRISDIENKPAEQQLETLQVALRSMEKFLAEFENERLQGRETATKVLKVSPIVEKVFNNVDERGVSYVTRKELNVIVQEAHRLEELRNPYWRIMWRRQYGLSRPRFEFDITTPVKEKHANVTCILAGKKKDLHLVLTN